MKKTLSVFMVAFSVFAFANAANAYQVMSSKELGRGDAKYQNVVVKCTTDVGKISNQTCTLRRYVKCRETASGAKSCSGWQAWKDLREPNSSGYSDWKAGASSCCRSKGLR